MPSIHACCPRRVLVLALTVAANRVLLAQAPAAAPPAPEAARATAPAAAPSADAQSSYSLGLVFGNQLRGAGLGRDLSMDEVVRGLKEGIAGKLALPEDRNRAVQLMRSGREAVARSNRALASDFLARNASAPGVKATTSGLQYQVIAEGDAQSASPTANDRVTVQYRGRLLDGTEFDSSDRHAQAATFSLNGVIAGWREALEQMKPGAKWRLFVPPALGYDVNSPPDIPPGSLLIYDLELVRIEPRAVLGAPGNRTNPPAAPAAR